MRRLKVDVAFDISNGQLPCSRRLFAFCHAAQDLRTTAFIVYDLEKHSKAARRDARKAHRSWFEEFLVEFVDTTVHEFVHFNEPPYNRTRKSEEMAQMFAKWGRRTRL